MQVLSQDCDAIAEKKQKKKRNAENAILIDAKVLQCKKEKINALNISGVYIWLSEYSGDTRIPDSFGYCPVILQIVLRTAILCCECSGTRLS